MHVKATPEFLLLLQLPLDRHPKGDCGPGHARHAAHIKQQPTAGSNPSGKRGKPFFSLPFSNRLQPSEAQGGSKLS